MKFCIICPITGLQRFASLSDTHLVLAQITDKHYMEFYRHRRRDMDETLILDNGAYEGGEAVSELQLLNAIEFYRPQWVVCPDKLFTHWEETYSMTKGFLDRVYPYVNNARERPYLYKTKFMAIPQTTPGDIISWVEGLLRICDELPIDGIGLPRALVTHYYPDPATRIKACSFIKARYPHLYVHAFGMANGDPNELTLLRVEGCDSVDSSAPVWRAWSKRYSLREYDRQRWNKNGSPCNFDAPLPKNPTALRQIEFNLKECGVDVSSL